MKSTSRNTWTLNKLFNKVESNSMVDIDILLLECSSKPNLFSLVMFEQYSEQCKTNRFDIQSPDYLVDHSVNFIE